MITSESCWHCECTQISYEGIRFSASALKAKTFGRVVDLTALREEMSCIQSFLEEFEEPLDFLCQTVLLLRERLSAHKERLESLKKRVKEQEELRPKFEVAARGPALPREIIDNVLDHVPSYNKLVWEGWTQVYVDGLIPLAIYNPRLLLPYYEGGFDSEWTLGGIAEQKLRRSILDDASLADHIKLRVEYGNGTTSDDASDWRPLMNYPHLWKTLGIYPNELVMDDFINWYKPCFPFLEELDIFADSVTSSTVVAPLDGSRLKTARLTFNLFSDFFNTGCLKSITSLRLYWFSPGLFVDRDAFKEALHIFSRIIGQLPFLNELALEEIWCDLDDLEGLPRIKSSLRSLDVNFDDYVLLAAVLSLFADCHIDSICIDAPVLREAEVIFGGVQRVCVSVSDISPHRDYWLTFILPGLRPGYSV